jgi:hypothetical protein
MSRLNEDFFHFFYYLSQRRRTSSSVGGGRRPRLKEDSAALSKVRFGSLEIIIYMGQYFVRRPRLKEDSAALSKVYVGMYECMYIRIYIHSYKTSSRHHQLGDLVHWKLLSTKDDYLSGGHV